MRTSLLQLGSLLALTLASSACSWSRFDDVTNDTPILLLDKPGSLKSGFGVSLSTATRGAETSVLVGGTPGISGAALFDLGDATSPSTTAVDSGYCTQGTEDCFMSSSTAGFANARGPDATRPLCFAVGTGRVAPTSGIVLRCQDASEYALPIPGDAEEELEFAMSSNQPLDHPLAADRTDDPVLLATMPTLRSAWFYPSRSLKFSELSAPSDLTDDESFGKTLAVLTVGDARVFAIGVPGKSEVLLWRVEGADSAYVGCLGGISGMGRALGAGPVNSDGDDDLVLSDDSNVHVIDGRALFELPATESTECSFSSLPSGALLGSFGCGSNSSLSGCDTSEFGAALAVGDLDGDGDGEVIVGAPNMTVRGESGAGALLVYDVETPSDASFVDAKFLSSAEGGDGMGSTIVTPHIAGRDIIVAGAPGNGKAAVFYCSPLLDKGAAGPRCP